MQCWEYLEIFVLTDHPMWCDSCGRQGTLMTACNVLLEGKKGAPFEWYTMSGALNELGSQGWELVSAVRADSGRDRYRLLLKRPRD